MKNVRRFFALVVSLTLTLTGFCGVGAFAAPNGVFLVPENDETEKVEVYVNDKEIKSVDVYMDDDGDIWIFRYSDLKKIFPTETKNLTFSSAKEATLLKDWAKQFDYTMTCKSSKVFLKSNKTSSTGSNNNSSPYLEKDTENIAKVYVNGMKVKDPDVYVDASGNIRLNDVDTLYDIFPRETRNLTLSSRSSTYLVEWANFYDYSYVQRGTRVYMNTDGVAPVEVHIGWDVVDFPDQQPYVLDGRTMIPVRAVSEALGWDVTYSNYTVTISNGRHNVTLRLNSNIYTLDGREKVLDVPAQIINDRTMVPIRFIAEAFGYDVDYYGEGSIKIVTLSK